LHLLQRQPQALLQPQRGKNKFDMVQDYPFVIAWRSLAADNALSCSIVFNSPKSVPTPAMGRCKSHPGGGGFKWSTWCNQHV